MSKKTKTIPFSGEIWLYQGKGGWHFLTLGKSTAQSVKNFMKGQASAWGAVPVLVQIDQFEWRTSVFPDKKVSSYLLPLKSSVRKKLNLSAGMRLRGNLTLERDSDEFE